jgi:hypothetical protein
MIASYGETSGFSAVSAEELVLVNGGKGGGGGSGGGGGNGFSVNEKGITYTSGSGAINVNGSLNPPSLTVSLIANW